VIYDVLEISPDALALQLCALDLIVFQSVSVHELIEAVCKEEASVPKYANRFNNIVLFTKNAIISESNPKRQSKVISHLLGTLSVSFTTRQ
jgi:hypothetical protein